MNIYLDVEKNNKVLKQVLIILAIQKFLKMYSEYTVDILNRYFHSVYNKKHK